MLSDDAARDLSRFIAEHDLKFYPVFDQGEQRLHALEDRAAEQSGTAQPVLEGFFYVELSGDQSIDSAYDITAALNNHPAVEFATIANAARAAVVADVESSTSTSLRGLQDWRGLGSTTGGAGIDYSWSYQGRGEGGKIIDVENAFNPDHVDFDNAGIIDYTDGTAVGTTDGNINHGTSSLGVLVGDNDCDGIVGAVPLSDEVGFVSARGDGTTVYPISCPDGNFSALGSEKAILIAAENLDFGDVLLLELSADIVDDGVSNADIPLETRPVAFCATKVATDAGIIFVTAAGNGGFDLDAGHPTDRDYAFNEASMALYEWRGWGDSGAIVVGAGSSDTNHFRLPFSSYGSRVDVQAWGENVYTSGRQPGGTGPLNTAYRLYSGTSSASSVVAAVAASVQSVLKLQGSFPGGVESGIMRFLLNDTGNPQGDPENGLIGPAVDAERAIASFLPDVTPTKVNLDALPITEKFISATNFAGLDAWIAVDSSSGGRARIVDQALRLRVGGLVDNAPGMSNSIADWHLDLSESDGVDNLVLSFLHKGAGVFAGPEVNEYLGMADVDGVFISQDGERWFRLVFPGMETQTEDQGENPSFVNYSTSLTSAISENGLDPKGTLRIRFQNYDNNRSSNDRMFDNVTLEEGDFGQFQLAESNVTASEGSDSVTIDLGLTAKQPTVTSVDYEITAITLQPPADLILAQITGRVTLEPDQTEAKINLPIFKDSLPEHTETFRLVLRRAGGGPVIDSSADSALVRITDNDQDNAIRTHHVRAGGFVIPALGNPIGNNSGPAPITLPVTGANGDVTKVIVKLSDFSHNFYSALDIFLEGPDGTFCKLLSDLDFNGPVSPIVNKNLTFEDGGDPLSPNQFLTSGTYQPYDAGISADTLLDGTTVNGAPLLSVFNGKDPNGIWKLHIVESGIGDSAEMPRGGGILQGGYELIIETANDPAPANVTITKVEHLLFENAGEQFTQINVFFIGDPERSFQRQISPDLSEESWEADSNPFTPTGEEQVMVIFSDRLESLFVRLIEVPE